MIPFTMALHEHLGGLKSQEIGLFVKNLVQAYNKGILKCTEPL